MDLKMTERLGRIGVSVATVADIFSG